MEIGDIFAVNKMDLPGASQLAAKTEAILEMSGRKLPIVLTNSINGQGVEELHSLIEKALEELDSSGAIEEKRRRRTLYNNLNSVYQIIMEDFSENAKLEELMNYLLENRRLSDES